MERTDKTERATDEMLKDLRSFFEQKSVADGRGKTASSQEAASARFGCIYFGKLHDFAEGANHYAMISDLRGIADRHLRMAPITSRAQRGSRKVLELEAGLLPGRRDQNQLRPVVSFVLLFWKTLYRRDSILQMEYHKKLPPEKLEAARRILQES